MPTTRVLIIYTGGTLGMTHREGSLSPEPEQGNLAALIRNMPEFGDTSLPAVDMLEYDPLLDSSNVGPAEWAMLAESVGAHYYDYDGFVVIHGTDTMCGRRTRAAPRNSSSHRGSHPLPVRRCYTASALSFMLEGLGKPVVLTGSMIPLCEPFNDARRNLIASVIFASTLELCEDHSRRSSSTTGCSAATARSRSTPTASPPSTRPTSPPSPPSARGSTPQAASCGGRSRCAASASTPRSTRGSCASRSRRALTTARSRR